MPHRAGNRDSTALSEIGPSHNYPLAEEIEDVSGRSDPAVMDAGRWPTYGHPRGTAAVLEPYTQRVDQWQDARLSPSEAAGSRPHSPSVS